MSEINNEGVMSLQDLEKASAIIGQVLQSYNTPHPLEQASPILEDPAKTLLSEKAIQNAPDHIICLAAFIAEFSDAVSTELKNLNAKLDSIIRDSATSADAVIKATKFQNELLKAQKEIPVNGFMHQPAFVAQPTLEKAKGAPTKGYIISKLEQLVKEGKASIYSISQFENTGKLPSDLEEAITASWNSDKVNV